MRKKKGFSILEVLVSFLIVVIAIFGVVDFILFYSNFNRSLENRILTYTMANQVLNNLLSRPYNNLRNLVNQNITITRGNITITYTVNERAFRPIWLPVGSNENMLIEIYVNATYVDKGRTISNIRLWGTKYRWEGIINERPQ